MITAETQKLLDLFAKGRRMYKMMQFAEAKKYFVAALKVAPNDGPSAEYVKRCDEFMQSPPPDDWDGVYVMKTK